MELSLGRSGLPHCLPSSTHNEHANIEKLNHNFHYCQPPLLFVDLLPHQKCVNDVIKYFILNRKFQYKRQLARPRCHSFVNQQRTRQELVIR